MSGYDYDGYEFVSSELTKVNGEPVQPPAPDLSTLDREALARMVGELEAQLTTAHIRIAETDATLIETLNECDRLRAENARKAEYLRELAKEHSAALDREQQVRNELAAARAEVERLKADMAFCGIGYNEDDELMLSMKPYNAFVRSKANETVAAESEQLKARVDHLTQELMREQDKAFALRAALAQVSDAVKAVGAIYWMPADMDAEAAQVLIWCNSRVKAETLTEALKQIKADSSVNDIATIAAASANACTCELHKGNHSECRKAAGLFVCCCAKVGVGAAAEGREAGGKQ